MDSSSSYSDVDAHGNETSLATTSAMDFVSVITRSLRSTTLIHESYVKKY